MWIAGGTDEIVRNIIAERIPALPGDIRASRDVAFKDSAQGHVAPAAMTIRNARRG
jgi:hypothetical protein